LDGEVVPTVITHGDLVPWNARIVDGTLKAFDWEYGSIDGVPGWDDLYFRIQVGLIHWRWRAQPLSAAVNDWMNRPVLPWTTRGQRALAALVLLDLAARHRRRNETVPERLLLTVVRSLVA
jgi:hypothetical protein